MKYYKVLAEQGHCGVKKSNDLVFYFEAENLIEAMHEAQSMPGIKHGKIPPYIKEISAEEYHSRDGRNAYHTI